MAAPSGTVTLLFTDIEGSTRLWEKHPGEMALALQRHDELMRSGIESAGGFVFKTVGDSFCAAFSSAKDAIDAVVTSQRALQGEAWPSPVAIRVRMALHTGECEERDGDYFGPTVNRTARLEATAHGGQAVVSRSTAELVRHRLPPGTSLIDLGAHLLKDMDHPEEVFQLAVDGLLTEFPPLRSRDAEIPTNLTNPTSSFVGRTGEVTDVGKLLALHHMVSLTGPGGTGKTRLAIEVGRAALPGTADGVWISELATVSDPDLVAAEVLSDLGIGEQQGRAPIDTLVDVLAGQNRLIILDNCEQILDGCAGLADAVIRRCPDVRILATSREPLRIEGETIYRVPPLSLPPMHVDDRVDLAGSGAVALFVERATAQVPDFELSDEDAPLVADICRRLDGMPLALELATARLRSMSLAKLHQRLEHRFGLLTGGNRLALPRQQTLRGLVDWSYDLLSEAEQALFRRVSVFVDGFGLEAVEGVCALDDIPDWDIADLLASLVDKSLVVAEPDGQDLRYRLQETLRSYGAERLSEVPVPHGGVAERERVWAAHAGYFLAFADEAATHLEGRDSGPWVDRLDAEELNLRAALSYLLSTEDGAGRVLDHFGALLRYWMESRLPAQTLTLLDAALEMAGPDLSAGRRGKALVCKAKLLFSVDLRLMDETLPTVVELARQAGDRSLEADALSQYSRSRALFGDTEQALATGAEALAIAREIDDPVLLGSVLRFFSNALELAEDPTAVAVSVEALEVVERSGDRMTAQAMHNNYSLVLMAKGDLDGAQRHLELALDIVGVELTRRSSTQYLNLAWVQLLRGDAGAAAVHFRGVLRICRLHGIVTDPPYAVLGLACCANSLGDAGTAARLHGGADNLLDGTVDQWETLEASIRNDDIARLRLVLGEEFDVLYAEGRALDGAAVVKLALTVE
jgi:predicted ATPase/class 3 adenylate cyclase